MIRTIYKLLFITIVIAAVEACDTYRIEYHKRPSYFRRLADGPMPDRVELEDGTVLVYETRDLSGRPTEGISENTFQLREELEDGSSVLRALIPEHVLANTLNCIRNGEYELLWDQMLSVRTKLAYAERGEGAEEFSAFFQKNRIDLAKTLNRMLDGITSYETVIEDVGDGVTVCRFWPQIAQQYRFKRVAIVREDFMLKLLLIG